MKKTVKSKRVDSSGIFLYPTSRQYPVDEVCERIVRELEKRNWEVPGISVVFNNYGNNFRHVSSIKSNNYLIQFCRGQGDMPGGKWINTAAVGGIVIPRKELRLYSDESGPAFYLYVGKDWKNDSENFINSIKIHSKLDKKPKQYLVYKGGCNCESTSEASFSASTLITQSGNSFDSFANVYHTHTGIRAPFLVHSNDLGREYDPNNNEPKVFRTDEVMEEFRKYLEDVVLKSFA